MNTKINLLVVQNLLTVNLEAVLLCKDCNQIISSTKHTKTLTN